MCNNLLQQLCTTQTYRTLQRRASWAYSTYLTQPVLTFGITFSPFLTSYTLLWCLTSKNVSSCMSFFFLFVKKKCGTVEKSKMSFSFCFSFKMLTSFYIFSYSIKLVIMSWWSLITSCTMFPPACLCECARRDGMLMMILWGCGRGPQLRRSDATTNGCVPRHRLTNCYNHLMWLADTTPE